MVLMLFAFYMINLNTILYSGENNLSKADLIPINSFITSLNYLTTIKYPAKKKLLEKYITQLTYLNYLEYNLRPVSNIISAIYQFHQFVVYNHD